MSNEGKIPCECGETMYGYYSNAGTVFMCYTCGKFNCEGFSKRVKKSLEREPTLILQLIEDGNLKPLSDITGI
jgi:hypothetical protein|tara:strand:- start:310 stop:528 length:219 start_codon:yes stop_codon:yes gene_type:complete